LPLTEEHLIPEALGGRLTAAILCRKCNSSLGHRTEASVRSDPTIRLVINDLSAELPALSRALSERQPFFAHGPGGTTKGYVKDGEFVVAARTDPDGSLIQPTRDARRAIDTILRRDGYDAPLRAEALRRFDEAPENSRVEIAPNLEIVKWQVAHLTVPADGPLIAPIMPVKIAFEFLALHLGTVIYDDAPPIAEARRVLRGGPLDPDWISVERLEANNARPFHGLVFEGNSPYAKVQIRLFGKLAFRVNFFRLSVGGSRAQYTHDLSSNREQISKVQDSRS
jgi:hypothetical protein